MAAAVLVAVGIAVLFGAGQAWTHDYLLWQVGRDAVFVSGVLLLGVRLGGDDLTPESAVRRAFRGFALLCAVLVCAAIAGSTPAGPPQPWSPPWSREALLIAVMRYRSLTELVAASDRLPSWPWLVAVTGAILCVVAMAALLGQLLSVDILRWLLSAAAAALSTALDAIIYAVGWAGAGLARALGWVLGLFHVRAPHLDLKPPPASRVKVVMPPYQPAAPAASATRLVGDGGRRPRGGGRVAGGRCSPCASCAAGPPPMRRSRRSGRRSAGSGRPPGRSPAGLGGGCAASPRWAAREAGSPAELVRLRYAQLEQRLRPREGPGRCGGDDAGCLVQCAAAMGVPPPVADVAGLCGLRALFRRTPSTGFRRGGSRNSRRPSGPEPAVRARPGRRAAGASP